ncbi:hypothetical protein GCM10010228_44760 [Streptomyces massasporeus]|nr:hypothetical protein GCM10010228_44760 [Streptomyces massasporeus]
MATAGAVTAETVETGAGVATAAVGTEGAVAEATSRPAALPLPRPETFARRLTRTCCGGAWAWGRSPLPARAVRRRSPRPPSPPPLPASRVSGSLSPRASLTSMRTCPPSSLLSRSSASRPGTRPWVTALAASSATISSTESCTGVPYRRPQASIWQDASPRASRAPRGDGVKRNENTV